MEQRSSTYVPSGVGVLRVGGYERPGVIQGEVRFHHREQVGRRAVRRRGQSVHARFVPTGLRTVWG